MNDCDIIFILRVHSKVYFTKYVILIIIINYNNHGTNFGVMIIPLNRGSGGTVNHGAQRIKAFISKSSRGNSVATLSVLVFRATPFIN